MYASVSNPAKMFGYKDKVCVYSVYFIVCMINFRCVVFIVRWILGEIKCIEAKTPKIGNKKARKLALRSDFGWNQVYGSQNHPSLLGSLGDFVVSAVKIPKTGKNK